MTAAPSGPGAFPDVFTLIEGRGKAHPDRVAIESAEAGTLTYGGLLARVQVLAGGIAAGAAEVRGRRPRLAIVLPNGPEMSQTLLAACAVGAAMPLNPAHRRAEFEDYLRTTRADFLLVRASETGPAIEAAETVGVPLLRVEAGGVAGVDAGGASVPRPLPDDVALVLLTSGSTGRPKSVPLTHRNVCTSARDVGRSINLGPDDRCLSMWEQFHIGGLVDLLLAPLAAGSTIIATGGFDAARFYEGLAESSPTWFQGVPATLNELLVHARRNAIDPRPNTLRLMRSVAAALPPRLMAELEELFGVPIIQTFGMTEAGPLITSTRLPPVPRKPGSVGASCGAEVLIAGPDGESLPAMETGQVAVRGPNVFAGYENDPAANASQFRDGWFYTGDNGYLDLDGDLFLTGRLKQLVNRGGEKVNLQEVEDALLGHDSVGEAAIFAVPHRTLGEDVAAAVVLRQGKSATAADLRGYLSRRLSSFKVPHRIDFLDRLPRNPVGKVDRLILAERARSETQADGDVAATPLETFLQRLWAVELDIRSVGLDSDFSELGGDSLSSLRLQMAVEKAVGIEIPEAAMLACSTVAGMAKALVSLGYKDDPARLASIDLAELLRQPGLKTPTASAGDILALREQWAGVKSLNQLEATREHILTYCTPGEIADVFRPAPRERQFRLPGLVEMRRRLLARSTLEEIGTASSAAWQRSVLAEGATLYAIGPAAGKTLLVGFAGMTHRMMMPVHSVLAHLDGASVHFLLLQDLQRRHYEVGIAGLGADIGSVADAVELFRSRTGYERAVALGTSAGGLAALYTALHNRWSAGVAVGPDNLDRHPPLVHAFGGLVPWAEGRARPAITVTYSGQNARDAEAASRVRAIVPWTEIKAEPRFSNHNLLIGLQKTGELPAFFGRVLA